MRQLRHAAFISLDGVIQAPGGAEEDPSGGFALGGWTLPFADGGGEPMGGALSRPFDLLLGRRTYDLFAGYWPNVAPDAPHRGIADQFNGVNKYVATHHADTLGWQHSRALGTDIVHAVRALKRDEGRDLLLIDSSELMHLLLATDLVDELLLLVFPLVLGAGKRLFDGGAMPATFRREDATLQPSGVIVGRYVRHGEVRTGA